MKSTHLKSLFCLIAAIAVIAAISLIIAACGDGGPAAVVSTPVALGSPARISFFANPGSQPLALAADSPWLLVTDYSNSTVSLLDPATLEVVSSFPITGRTLSVAALDNMVYVGNDGTGSVEVYDWLGWKKFNLGFDTGNIGQPQDIAIDAGDGLVFVADGADDDVKVFQWDGAFVRSITGTGAYRLVSPTAVAVDEANNRLIVSDYGEPVFNLVTFNPPPPRVIIFDYSGNALGMISGEGTLPAGLSSGTFTLGMGLPPAVSYGFSRPQGLAYDSEHVFLVDCLRNVVLVFDISGAPAGVKTLGGFGSGDGQFFLPLDVVVDPATKDVFVTDNRNARVVVFPAGGLIP